MPSRTIESPTVYDKAQDFLKACSQFMCTREAENNLILSIGSVLGTPSSPYSDFYLASVGTPQVEGVFLMTPPHKLLISAPASERAIASTIAHFQSSGRPLPGVMGPAEPAVLFSQLWEQRTGERTELALELFCYKLSQVRPVPRASGNIRKASVDDLELLAKWSRQFDIDAHTHPRDDSLIRQVLESGIAGGAFYVWVDGEPVSMAKATDATPSGARIAAVYTPSEHRGHGYASSLVAEISAIELSQGKTFCFLFTDAGNATTNKIYQRIGYEHVGDFHEHVFAKR